MSAARQPITILMADDDPDDRRTYPWADLGGTPDTFKAALYDNDTTPDNDVSAANSASPKSAYPSGSRSTSTSAPVAGSSRTRRDKSLSPRLVSR